MQTAPGKPELFCIAGWCESIVNSSYGRQRNHPVDLESEVMMFSRFPPTQPLQSGRNDGRENVGALLVMDEEELVGVISERDYTRKVMVRGKKSKKTRVAEIMSTDVTVTNPNESVEKCLRATELINISAICRYENDKIVGVISIGDLVKHVISCQSAAIAHLENYISGGYTG